MKWQSKVYWNEKMFGTSKLISENAVYIKLHIFITQHKEVNTVDQFLLTSFKSIYNRSEKQISKIFSNVFIKYPQ